MATEEITKIEELTPEQEAMFEPHVQKWTNIGLCTDPADRPRAMAAVRGLYKQSELKSCPLAFVSSPIVGALAASLLAVIIPGIRKLIAAISEEKGFGEVPHPDYDNLKHLDERASEFYINNIKQTLSDISDDWVPCDDPNVISACDMIVNSVLEAEWLPLLNRISRERSQEEANKANMTFMLQAGRISRDAALKETLEWHAWYGGQFWCAFSAWATFFRDCLGHPVPQIEHEAALCESAGYIWPNEDFCLICDRPRQLHVTNDRLNNPDGPAMEYPDKWQLWFIDGHRIPLKKIVLAPETVTLDEIEKEQNEEVKRIMINRWGGRDESGELKSNIVGWSRYINESGATTLDTRMNEVEKTMELLVRTKSSNMTMFVTHCPSTGRQYALEVPNTVKTCKDAQLSLQQGNSLTGSGKTFNIVGRS